MRRGESVPARSGRPESIADGVVERRDESGLQVQVHYVQVGVANRRTFPIDRNSTALGRITIFHDGLVAFNPIRL